MSLIDRSKQDKIDKRDRRKKERDFSDVRKVISSVEGRRLFWRILSHAGLYKSSFTGNTSTYFEEGRRSEGLYWLDELMQSDQKAFAMMQAEHYSEAKSEEMQRTKEEKNNE